MVNYQHIQKEIEKMFTCPTLSETRYSEVFGDQGERPLLFLLRRDLMKYQYGPEDAQPTDDGMHSPLLTCLGIMVGFELLTKLWAGQMEINRELLKQFLRMFSTLSINEKADALVRFRNAIAHSYSLTDVARDGKKYRFRIDADAHNANKDIQITSSGNEKRILINVWWLKKLFLDSIKSYRKRLSNELELQCKFYVARQELGKIQIRKSEKSPD